MFTATKPLPLTVPTIVGESATSLASRLARRNGVPRMITFCSDVGIDYFALVNGDPVEVQRLAVLGDIDPVPLQASTPSLIEPGWFRLGNERIKFTGLIRTTLRICPRCVQDATDRMGVVHLGMWQVASIRTCQEHRCRLVAVPKPKNGNDCFDHIPMLDGFKPAGGDLAVSQNLELERYLTERTLKGPRQTWLDRLPFHIATQTCEMFGALLTLGLRVKRAELTDAQWGAAGTAGLSILRGGSEALRKNLEEIQDSYPVGEKLYRSRYGVFFDWLRFRDDDPDFDVVRDVVREFIFENFPVTVGSIVLGRPCPEQHVHSFATAKQVFGIAHHRLGQKLFTLGMAKPHASDRFYTLTRYIPTALLIDIIAELGTRLSAKEAAKIVGVETVVLARLASHGLIPKLSEYGKRSTIYRPEDLEAFLNQLRGLAKPAGATKDLIDLSTAARRRGVTIAALAKLILAHRIPLYFEAGSAEDFRAFRVHPNSLSGIYRRPQEPVVSSWSVARLLKISRPTVYRLRRAGFLTPPTKRKSAGIRGGKYSCRKSFENFQAAHISLNELIERSGRSADDEFNHQISNGALPLPLGLQSTMIFRRTDVD
ncbi:MAG: TniQ family protein [Paracoccus sp. (in: a-proteobacteria)]|nr:TniQ family protein [Paracoccus sp. (in: a-proteobacteria)]